MLRVRGPRWKEDRTSRLLWDRRVMLGHIRTLIFFFCLYLFFPNGHKVLKELETSRFYVVKVVCVLNSCLSILSPFSPAMQTTSLPGSKFSGCILCEMLSLTQLPGTVAVITSDGRMIVVSIGHIHSFSAFLEAYWLQGFL